MSLVVTEKASLANDDGDSHTSSKDSRLEEGDASLGGVSQGAKGAQQVGGNDKDNDNEKYAFDAQQRGLPPAEPTQPHPSNGPTSNKSARKVQEHKNGASTETLRNDTIPLSASARRPSTTSRFKEKRPEPLKLNPNQEIPLDLSVKSAGNVPSGNIFNLALINNLMGPLETPRIQWQDNDALLTSAKGRLFSSSTNASQRARLSSLIGDSPPITPGTPSMDIMFSSSGAPSSTRPSGSNDVTNSALHALDSPLHSFLTSPFDLNKLRTPLINHHHQHNHNKHNVQAGDSKGTPRRSCSTDNLSVRNTNSTLSVNQDGLATNNKKQNSVSPLAIKSVSNQFGAAANNSVTATKFLYSNQQIAYSKIDAQRSPTSSSSSSINGSNGKSLTPTSVANATANLLNIHLNSPNGHSSESPVNSMLDGSVQQQQQQQQQQTPYKTSHFPEPSPLDPLLSAVSYCQQQQQQQQQRSPFGNIPSTSSSSDHFHHQSGLLNSLSSTATLNTPTLISPSQIKAGHMCFLPSPTLSPMSSVFELPSPLLMFPPPSTSTHLSQQQQQQSNRQRGGSANTATTSEANSSNNNNKSPRGGESSRNDASAAVALQAKVANVKQNQSDTLSASRQCHSSSENDLSEKPRTGANANELQQLITTAAQKSQLKPTGNTDNEDTDGDVNMDIDNEDDTNHETGNDSRSIERPATVIPQICVSNHHRDGQVKKVDDSGCRGSHWVRANEQHINNERHESSSAPPEVYRPVWAKSKLKTILADSCCNLTGVAGKGASKNVVMVRADNLSVDKPTSFSHSNINQSFTQRDRSTSKPYPVIRRLNAASSQQIQSTGSSDQNGHSSCLETTRSNSAEPAFYQRNPNALKLPHQNSSSNGESSCSSGQLYLKQNISISAQHLTHAIKAESQSFASNFSSYQLTQEQRQQVGQVHPNQQHQSQSQGLVYDQQQYYHRPQAGVHQRNEFGYGHHQQQQNSVSANDLHRLQNNRHTSGAYPPVVSSHMIAAATAAVNNSNNSMNTNPSQGNRLNQPQQHFFQQNLQSIPLSPMNRFDTFQSSYNGYQQQFAQQQQQQQHNMSNNTPAETSASLLRLAERQTSSHLLSNEALLRRTTMNNNSMATTRGDQVASFASDNATLHCAGYPLESESRSESRSSCSLDFTNSFSGGGSGRLVHSSGGSNLVAKKYHCDHCSKSFTRSDMLTRHRRLHSGDRPFQCNECKQEFSRSDHLSTHMRTHTGEKPYKCKLCSYSACRKDMITRHLKVHNRNPHSTEPI